MNSLSVVRVLFTSGLLAMALFAKAAVAYGSTLDDTIWICEVTCRNSGSNTYTSCASSDGEAEADAEEFCGNDTVSSIDCSATGNECTKDKKGSTRSRTTNTSQHTY